MDDSVVVVGMGVVGLPTALLLAKAGYQVFGVDINKTVIDVLNNGKLPPQVTEKELQSLLNDFRIRKNIFFQQKPNKAETFIIAVPTPLDASRKKADLAHVKKAIEAITPYIKKGDLVIIESTIPPKTCRNFITPLLEKSGLKIGRDIFLAHCPERVLPGSIYKEIIENDRIIGGVDEMSCKLAEKIYKSFIKGKIYTTDDVTAELCKLMENSYRDVNIALANEFSAIAQGLGVNPKKAIEMVNKHPRVNVLTPGIGVGGHCIPIDPWFIYEVDKENSTLIKTSRKVNDEMPSKIAAKIEKEVKDIKNPKIVAIGASYKANTSDTRESPAVEIVRLIKKDGYNIAHFDPLIDKYKFPTTLVDACLNADLLVILVPHKVVLEQLNARRLEILARLRNPRILEF